MKAFGSIVAGTYTSLCVSLAHCLPRRRDDDTTVASDHEKEFDIISQQPARVAPPAVWYPAGKSRAATRKARAPRRRKASSLGSFSLRRGLLSNASSTTLRRPQISAPTNFQHVHSASFQFPELAAIQATEWTSFRPLELSINLQNNRLSPMLPHFDGPSPPVTPPHKITPYAGSGDSTQRLARSRSYSTTSFHVPRTAISAGSVFDSPVSQHSQHTSTPSPPKVMRKRAYTSSDAPPCIMEDLVERVAQAMLERDKLQHQIDDVIERQSVYTVSRPASPQDMEPMPEVPALPPNAPSFSERLNGSRTPTAQQEPLSSHPISSSQRVERRLPPPLPLRLRPPLRKKKSFSRISSWLAFQGADPKESQLSLDSLTNFPRPITDNDGFYEVAQPPITSSRRSSFDSISSASDWSAEEEQTVPTCWSPSSDTTIKAIVDLPTSSGPALGRGPQRSNQGRACTFPVVSTQQLRQPTARTAPAMPRSVGVAV